MARVDVMINGRTYPVACGDGQEDRVREMARYVEGRVAEIKTVAGSASDTHLLVMAALLLADELADSRAAEARAGGAGDRASDRDGEVAAAIGRLAGRMEAIAARLERA